MERTGSKKQSKRNNIDKPRPTSHFEQAEEDNAEVQKKPIVQKDKSGLTRALDKQFSTAKTEEVKRAIASVVAKQNHNVGSACKFLMLPKGTTDQPRYNPGIGNRETAAAVPFIRADIEYSGSEQFLPSNAAFAAKFRDPVRSVVLWNGNPSQFPSTYSAGVSMVANYGANTTGGARDLFTMPSFPLAGLATFKPNGTHLYPGKSEDGSFFYWVPSGATFAAFNTYSQSVYVGIRRWVPNSVPTTIITAANTASGASQTFVVPSDVPGYYLQGTFGAGSNGIGPTMTATFTITYPITGYFCQLSMRDLELNAPSMGEMRHLSASLMYTNTSPPIYRQGQVAAKQVPKETQWTDYVSSKDPFTFIASQSGSYINDLVNGYYGFLKPIEFGDLEFFDQTTSGQMGALYANQPVQPFFRLDTDAEFLVIGTQVSNQEGRNGYWTFVDGVEYVTNDQFRSVCEPSLSAAEWAIALDIVGHSQQHYTNFSHIAELISLIRAALKGGSKMIRIAGPGILNAAKWLENNL